MEKLMEKRNLGIPVTILTLLAFFIGYWLTVDYSILLVAVLFAALVFSFQFDDKVKTAVKQSYIICFITNIVFMGLKIIFHFSELVTPYDYETSKLQTVFENIYRYGLIIVNIAVIIVYILFFIYALMKKDIKISFVSNILGEGIPKPQPMYQQPMQPMYQQPGQPVQPQIYNQPQQQPIFNQPSQQPAPVYQQPQQPVQQPPTPAQPVVQPSPGIKCTKCGTENKVGAIFCASCGAKL